MITGGAAELLSWLLQFRDINNPPFFSGPRQAGDFYVNPVLVRERAEIPTGVVRDRWSYTWGWDKRLFIQRGRKLIRDATSLHFLSAYRARIPFFKKNLRRSRE